jgi:hypothetical protein
MTSRPAPPKVLMRSQKLSPRNLSQDDFCVMETANMAIALVNQHCSQQHHANAVVHPVTGKEMEYTALMKDPSLQPLWKQGLATKSDASFKAFMISLEPTHVSLSTLQTFQKTDRSLTAKLFVIISPTKKKSNASD